MSQMFDEYHGASVSPAASQPAGQCVIFPTGACKSDSRGKGRPALMPADALTRVAKLYERGAEKMGVGNWEKGIPIPVLNDALFRHVLCYLQGHRGEDHLSAVVFNALTLIAYQERGLKPAEHEPRGEDDLT